jgi:hypothetical protein
MDLREGHLALSAKRSRRPARGSCYSRWSARRGDSNHRGDVTHRLFGRCLPVARSHGTPASVAKAKLAGSAAPKCQIERQADLAFAIWFARIDLGETQDLSDLDLVRIRQHVLLQLEDPQVSAVYDRLMKPPIIDVTSSMIDPSRF